MLFDVFEVREFLRFVKIFHVKCGEDACPNRKMMIVSSLSKNYRKKHSFRAFQRLSPSHRIPLTCISRSTYSSTTTEEESERVENSHLSVAEEFMTENYTQTDIAHSLREHYGWQAPVVLRGACLNTEAVKKWDDLDYLKSKVGEHTICEVEIGSSYNDPEMVKPQIPFGQYLDYIRLFEDKYGRDTLKQKPNPEDMVYLAQNELFEELKEDIPIPQLCDDASFNVGNQGALYYTMLWFGPMSTLSPLHYDPLDNLLMQIVGSKRVLLYPRTSFSAFGSAPTEIKRSEHYGEHDLSDIEKYLYVRGEGLSSTSKTQYNTSPVDVENPDLEKYPLFSKMPQSPLHTVLYPGDMLYIPQKWWHCARSLERSISVNAWFR